MLSCGPNSSNNASSSALGAANSVPGRSLEADLERIIELDEQDQQLTQQRRQANLERAYLIEQCNVQNARLRRTEDFLHQSMQAADAASSEQAADAPTRLEQCEAHASSLHDRLELAIATQSAAHDAHEATDRLLRQELDQRLVTAVSDAQRESAIRNREALAYLQDEYAI